MAPKAIRTNPSEPEARAKKDGAGVGVGVAVGVGVSVGVRGMVGDGEMLGRRVGTVVGFFVGEGVLVAD